MIKVQNNTATREPLPSFLQGLAPESLADLSWTDPQLGVQDVAWWPEEDQTPALEPDQTHDGTEVLTVDTARSVVVVVRGIRNMTTEELHERWLAENPVPQEVTMGQCRLALFDTHGIENDEMFLALADILPPEDRPRALVEMTTRPTVRYDNPLVQALCDANGWDRDELFRYAAKM